jgi:hypothetical protein
MQMKKERLQLINTLKINDYTEVKLYCDLEY